MEDEVGVVRTAIADGDIERRAAIGALRVDRAVGLERRPDPECIPCAVGEPRSSGGLHPEGRGPCSERIGHRDLTRVIEHERVRIVESSPAFAHGSFGDAVDVGDLRGSWRPTEFHEPSIGRIAQVDIGGVHGGTVREQPGVVKRGVGQATIAPASFDPALERHRQGGYRRAMATGDSDETKPLGFSIDIDEILKDVAGARRRTTRRRSTTDMDAALRRAVRAELVDVERALKLLAAEVVRLRKANEALADKITKLTRR